MGLEPPADALLLGFGLTQVAPEGVGEAALDEIGGALHLHERLFLDRVGVGEVLDELGLGIVVRHGGQLPGRPRGHASARDL
ncbi:MAG TPA: hypothetical protein VFN82_00750 [Solirubrobacterales bacterium]|nr:hypothetical protein [Solirubrobacterales bacterium]